MEPRITLLLQSSLLSTLVVFATTLILKEAAKVEYNIACNDMNNA